MTDTESPRADVELTEAEALSRDLTLAVMAHYGYTAEDIAEAEAVHPGRVCDEGCWDADGENVHPSAYNDLGATAALMVEVVTPALADHIEVVRSVANVERLTAVNLHLAAEARAESAEAERDEAWQVAAARRNEARRYYVAWSSAQMRARSLRAERDDLRARLLAVEALPQQILNTVDPLDSGADVRMQCVTLLRAVLASPSTHTQRDTEPCPYCRAPHPEPCHPGCAGGSE